MARYYFLLIEQDDSYRDGEGVELPNDEAARREAALIAAEVLRDAPPGNGLVLSVQVVVYDQDNQEVWRNTLSFETISGRTGRD